MQRLFREHTFFLGNGLVFLLSLAIVLLTKHYELAVIPFGVLFAFAVYQDFRIIWWSAALTLPFSIEVFDIVGDSAMSLPTDLFAVALGGIFFLLLFNKSIRNTREILSNPVSMSIFVYLGWMLADVFFSTHVVVSLKYFIIHTIYVLGFYFMALTLFSANDINWEKFMAFLSVTSAIIMVYILFRHLGKGFSFLASYRVVKPFFFERSIYGQFVSGVLPISVAMIFLSKKRSGKLLFLSTSGVIAIALVLSYTRGAWLGTMVSVGALFTVLLWKKLKYVLLSGILLGIALIGINFDNLMREMQTAYQIMQNRNAKLVNVSSMERINRWHSAWNMFEKRPVRGFGPGTYAVEYGTFQVYRYRTPISTNHGINGTAHNEYLLALSELGILGLITFIGLVATSIIITFRVYFRTKSKQQRIMLLAAFLSLVSFYTHGLVNNFLNQDKVGAQVWVSLATIAMIYIQTKKVDPNEPTSSK